MKVELSRPPEMKDYYHLQPDGRYYEVRGFFLFGKYFTYLVYFTDKWKPIWWLMPVNAHILLMVRKQAHIYRDLIFLVWLFIWLLLINIVLAAECL